MTQPTSTALTVSGSFAKADAVNATLALAAEKFHVLSPSTHCPILPVGCVVSLTPVAISVETDTFDVGGGKRSITRAGLLRLANAAGVQWRTGASGRRDDGRNPYLVHWHAEGAWRSLDGTWLPVTGDCLMDLRDDSAQTRKILESARAKTDRNTGRVLATAESVGRIQLRDTRAKLLEHAQSKAQCRAIRAALAIRTYTAAELATKHFLVARLAWVGTDDAEDRRAIRESFLGAHAALFGDERAPRFALPAAAPVRQLPQTTDDGEILDDPPDAIIDEPQRANADAAPQPEPQQQQASEPQGASSGPAVPDAELVPDEPTARSGHVIPGGRAKGTPIEDADDRDLRYWADRIAQALEDGTGRPEFRERDETLVRAMRAEMARRDRDR